MSGFDELWFIGDNFAASTYRNNFKKAGTFYAKERFEVKQYMNSRFSDKNQNLISRIVNSFAAGLARNKKLPRLIVVVLDEDIIENVQFDGCRVSTLYGEILQWIAAEFDRMIKERKAQLPKNALKKENPEIYWVAAPYNRNFQNGQNRNKFNMCLESIVKIYEYMRCIKLKKVWAPENGNLVNSINGKITTEGLHAYWRAIDASIEFNFNFKERQQNQKKMDMFRRQAAKWENRDFVPNFDRKNHYRLGEERRSGDQYRWSKQIKQT